MQYALLIYAEEPDEVPGDQSAMFAEYGVFSAHIKERGAYRAGEALWPTSAATTVRVRDGRTLTTDGPFAETKEALGGFYLIEATDLDEAIRYAEMIPGAREGSVEIRPIIDISAAVASEPAGA